MTLDGLLLQRVARCLSKLVKSHRRSGGRRNELRQGYSYDRGLVINFIDWWRQGWNVRDVDRVRLRDSELCNNQLSVEGRWRIGVK